MIQIPLTPEQYEAALKHIETASASDVTSYILPTADNPGQLVTPLVTLQFTYDQANLNVTVLEKHGEAHFASENKIKSKLTDLLVKV